MIKALAAAAMILLLAPCAALAQHRATSAALGAVSGAVVLGPIGAVAGAFIGYTAGPSMSRAWGVSGSSRSASSRQQRRTASNDERFYRESQAAMPPAAAPQPAAK